MYRIHKLDYEEHSKLRDEYISEIAKTEINKT